MALTTELGGNLVNLLIPEHPIFDQINADDNWDSWSVEKDFKAGKPYACGKYGGIWQELIAPLNKSMLAVGASYWRGSSTAIKMVISDAKIGKGISLLTQAKATKRYGQDSVATKYVQNCLKYIISDETKFSEPLGGLSIDKVNYRECAYLDLQEVSEHEVIKDESWLTTVKSGLVSCGGLRFKVPENETAVIKSKTVFELPQTMKYMDPKWEAERQRRKQNQKGLLKTNIETLYIMAAFTGNIPDNTPALKIIINYKDGTKSEKILLAGKDITSVENSDNLENALYVGNGFHVTRWLMPHSDKPAKNITMVPTDSVILGGVTATLIREKMFFDYK